MKVEAKSVVPISILDIPKSPIFIIFCRRNIFLKKKGFFKAMFIYMKIKQEQTKCNLNTVCQSIKFDNSLTYISYKFIFIFVMTFESFNFKLIHV